MVYKFLMLFCISNFGSVYMVYSSINGVIDSKQNLCLQELKQAVVLSDEEKWNHEIVNKLNVVIKNSLNSIKKEIKNYSEDLRLDSIRNDSDRELVLSILKKPLFASKLEEYIDYCIEHEPLDSENNEKASKLFLDFLNSEDFKNLDQHAQAEVRPFVERIQRYLDNRSEQLRDPFYLHKENLEKLPKICSICKTFNFVMISQNTKEIECKRLLDDDF